MRFHCCKITIPDLLGLPDRKNGIYTSFPLSLIPRYEPEARLPPTVLLTSALELVGGDDSVCVACRAPY